MEEETARGPCAISICFLFIENALSTYGSPKLELKSFKINKAKKKTLKKPHKNASVLAMVSSYTKIITCLGEMFKYSHRLQKMSESCLNMYISRH
jgi:hypothetical protein